MNDMNAFINKLQTKSQTDLKAVDKKLQKISSKLRQKSELTQNLNATKLDKNRSIPIMLLDDDRNVKSFSAAFDYLFPGQKFDDEEQVHVNPLRYQEYELEFDDLPADL
ncbi:Hypothetical_protein [Hexamita inflata]|uniref:Hypothetical_protein n=1 Tax=Hexamita inflata TaxID=28002 RepID=A0ABP1HHV1_9EUKA